MQSEQVQEGLIHGGICGKRGRRTWVVARLTGRGGRRRAAVRTCCISIHLCGLCEPSPTGPLRRRHNQRRILCRRRREAKARARAAARATRPPSVYASPGVESECWAIGSVLCIARRLAQVDARVAESSWIVGGRCLAGGGLTSLCPNRPDLPTFPTSAARSPTAVHGDPRQIHVSRLGELASDAAFVWRRRPLRMRNDGPIIHASAMCSGDRIDGPAIGLLSPEPLLCTQVQERSVHGMLLLDPFQVSYFWLALGLAVNNLALAGLTESASGSDKCQTSGGKVIATNTLSLDKPASDVGVRRCFADCARLSRRYGRKDPLSWHRCRPKRLYPGPVPYPSMWSALSGPGSAAHSKTGAGGGSRFVPWRPG